MTILPDPPTPPTSYDVVVVGAGTVGLTLALALARTGLRVALVGPPAAAQAGRTVALLDGSARLFAALGLWAELASVAAPLRT